MTYAYSLRSYFQDELFFAAFFAIKLYSVIRIIFDFDTQFFFLGDWSIGLKKKVFVFFIYYKWNEGTPINMYRILYETKFSHAVFLVIYLALQNGINVFQCHNFNFLGHASLVISA